MANRFCQRCFWILLLLLLPAAFGCGGSQASVSGTVTYEGEEIERGYISFFPIDGKGPSAGAEILAGRYSASGLTPGKNRVVISAVPKELVKPMTQAEAFKVKAKLKGGSPV